ncbi:SCO3374 family protein [Streptomyces sp. NPDC046759]|uniref:SCO3374 family protein n=1 Tax=Streptomyces sp. NPDC046759 TaxID=3155019 RepID=UPI0033DA5835
MAGPDPRARHWYENDLGWPTVPGWPLRLLTGVRFDVLDVPAEAGAGALRHLAPGSPVALRGDRMELLVAAGSAEELPGLLDWLEWSAVTLDLRVLGTGGAMEAPLPPAAFAAGDVAFAAARTGVPAPATDLTPGSTRAGVSTGAGNGASVGIHAASGAPTAISAGSPASAGVHTGSGAPRGVHAGNGASVGVHTGNRTPRGVHAASPASAGVHAGSGGAPARSGAALGAAVWLRPPGPGGEVEASLPAMPAMGREGSAPDLVRLVETVAVRCHRIRLRRLRAGLPTACREDQPLAFS